MKPEFSLATPVQFLKSVGPARARALTRLGIETVGDLLAHYPRRYFDRTSCLPIGRARPGQDVTVLGEVLTCSDRRTRQGGNLLTVTLGDDTGVMFCVWFNQKFLKKQFKPGQKVMASGTVQFHSGRPQLAHPDFEALEAEPAPDAPAAGLHTGRMVPVYGLTAGIGQYWLRGLMDQALERAEAHATTSTARPSTAVSQNASHVALWNSLRTCRAAQRNTSRLYSNRNRSESGPVCDLC